MKVAAIVVGESVVGKSVIGANYVKIINRIITTCLGRRGCVFISVATIFLGSSALVHAQSLEDKTFYLSQGWDSATRQKVSYTSFGSRFIPYEWFLALEQPDNNLLFRDNTHMETLGFIAAAPDRFNPDGLPIGLARDTNGKGEAWVGLTCAACHTGQVSINGQQIRIDGGQSLIDFTRYEETILSALKKTIADDEKFSRFAQRVIASKQAAKKQLTAQHLKISVQERINGLTDHLAVNATEVPYGHGRLDAFGQIFNAIATEALNIPENKHSPNAPTSFPVLWDASHLDLVQWNASAPNKEPGPLFQNAITALAVYGTVTVIENKLTYKSSIQVSNLGYIQSRFYQLTAPQWPVKFAGDLDAAKVKAGAALYQQECVECHQLVDSTDKKRKLRAVLTPAAEVGTDGLMVDNFNNLRVKTGILEGDKSMVLFGNKLPAETSPMDLVLHVAVGSLLNQPWQSIKALFQEHESNYEAPAQTVYNSYKARPINGVWSSAPYLHNGSVPSIYDLLLPAAQRPTVFYVGNRELDVVKVGHVYAEAPNATRYDTALKGNSNIGHEYGTQLTDDERWALVEYIKSL